MQNLTEKVYECSLAVEAHMICDLLAAAGISARVDGEFLQSGAGELPLGNLVKVRVEPARAAEAREVIAEWEKSQPPGGPTPPAKSSRLAAPLLLFFGAIAGATLVLLLLELTATNSGVDYNGDGRSDTIFNYTGNRLSSTDMDRNLDGRTDARWTFDWRGLEKHYEADDDFDGRFEWQSDVENGSVIRSVLDTDGDGRAERVLHFRNGVIASQEFHFASGGRIVKREFYDAGLLVSAEFDDDGDGRFERRVAYDAHGELRH